MLRPALRRQQPDEDVQKPSQARLPAAAATPTRERPLTARTQFGEAGRNGPNYLDAQAKASDRLPPDRHRPLLEDIQMEAERVESDAERACTAANARSESGAQQNDDASGIRSL